MAVTPQGAAPYTAAAPVIGIIRRYRDKGLPSPINDDVLGRSGLVPESLIPRTLQSLQILELIDDKGQPTATLQKIRSVPEADYKLCLGEWLRTVYSDVFAFVDPAKDTGMQVRDAFRGYIPHGQQDRMVTLFLSLCVEAGITTSDTKKSAPKTAARKPYKVYSGVPVPPKQRKALEQSPRAPSHTQMHGLAPALAGILQSIPSPDVGWKSKEDRDRFVLTFGTVLDYVIPIGKSVSAVEDAGDDVDEEDAS
jgi:hypothetical protein